MNSLNKKMNALLAIACSIIMSNSITFAADNAKKNKMESKDKEMLEQFVQSKGFAKDIVFKNTNIKQFWVSNNVIDTGKDIKVILDQEEKSINKSGLQRIQLANIDNTLDCTVYLITKENDFSFDIYNENKSLLSQSEINDSFLDFNVYSSRIHLAETDSFRFDFEFSSAKQKEISIEEIILSFSKNTRNNVSITSKDTYMGNGIIEDADLFVATGVKTQIYNRDVIPVSENQEIRTRISIKNTGDVATTIYVGFVTYGKDRVLINAKNYPFKDLNKTLKVLSAKKGEKTIIVDSKPEWAKNCYIAVDVDESLNNVPNEKLLDGKIMNVEPNSDNQVVITLSVPLADDIPTNTRIRINGLDGYYIYTQTLVIQPNEEKEVLSSIKLDLECHSFTGKALSKGIETVKPLILSYSLNSNSNNTIQIVKYDVSY